MSCAYPLPLKKLRIPHEKILENSTLLREKIGYNTYIQMNVGVMFPKIVRQMTQRREADISLGS